MTWTCIHACQNIVPSTGTRVSQTSLARNILSFRLTNIWRTKWPKLECLTQISIEHTHVLDGEESLFRMKIHLCACRCNRWHTYRCVFGPVFIALMDKSWPAMALSSSSSSGKLCNGTVDSLIAVRNYASGGNAASLCWCCLLGPPIHGSINDDAICRVVINGAPTSEASHAQCQWEYETSYVPQPVFFWTAASCCASTLVCCRNLPS